MATETYMNISIQSGCSCILCLVRAFEERPELLDRYKFDQLNGSDFVAMISYNPKFIDRCDCDKLTARNWNEILDLSWICYDHIDYNRINAFRLRAGHSELE